MSKRIGNHSTLVTPGEGGLVKLPESLPARLYLLAYDTEKNRMTAGSQLGLVLRAAALADLYLTERLTDEAGKAHAAGGGGGPPGTRCWTTWPGRSRTAGRAGGTAGSAGRSAGRYAPYASSSKTSAASG